jgi:hypothetical protein
MCDQAGHGFLSFPNTYKGIIFKSDVKALSSWHEELKVANSAFHKVGSVSRSMSSRIIVVCVEKLTHKI